MTNEHNTAILSLRMGEMLVLVAEQGQSVADLQRSVDRKLRSTIATDESIASARLVGQERRCTNLL